MPIRPTIEQAKPGRFCWYPLRVSLVKEIQRKQNPINGLLGYPLALTMRAINLPAWFIILDIAEMIMSPVLPGKEKLILQTGNGMKLLHTGESKQTFYRLARHKESAILSTYSTSH